LFSTSTINAVQQNVHSPHLPALALPLSRAHLDHDGKGDARTDFDRIPTVFEIDLVQRPSNRVEFILAYRLVFCTCLCPRFTATFAATLFAPERASAQQPSAKIPRVGFLSSAGSERTRLLGAFREGLRDHGYVEGRSVILDLRFGGGDLTHELKMAAELVNLPVDVIVTEGVPSNAVDPSGQIPIVAPALNSQNTIAEGELDMPRF
jgi:hypothetical protein